MQRVGTRCVGASIVIEAPDMSGAVRQALGDRLLESREEHGWSIATVASSTWLECAATLKDELDLDYLSSLTALDLKEEFELVAHLYSISGGRKLALKCRLARDTASVRSLAALYRAADWHERECAEMFGITFEGHPNPVPILLPDGFQGYPLRKDYDDTDQD